LTLNGWDPELAQSAPLNPLLFLLWLFWCVKQVYWNYSFTRYCCPSYLVWILLRTLKLVTLDSRASSGLPLISNRSANPVSTEQ